MASPENPRPPEKPVSGESSDTVFTWVIPPSTENDTGAQRGEVTNLGSHSKFLTPVSWIFFSAFPLSPGSQTGRALESKITQSSPSEISLGDVGLAFLAVSISMRNSNTGEFWPKFVSLQLPLIFSYYCE